MQTKTKKSVIKALEEKFESVEYIAGKKNQKAKFILTNYNGSVEDYNPYKNNSGQPLDWNNEIFVIQNLINQEVARNDDEFYKGFTISQILSLMLGFGSCSEFDKARKKEILLNEVVECQILSMSGNKKNDYYGLKESVNNLIRNQKYIYMAMIEKEIKKTNHNINFLNSNGENIDEETYQEYFNFKKQLTKELKAENNKEKELKNQYYEAGMSTKDFDIKNEVQLLKEIDNDVQEKFGFKFAYRLFTVSDEIQVERDGEGDIEKARGNFYNRIMKNANSSQSKHEKTEEINYFEKPFYRLCHAGLYEEVMKSIFSQLVGVESKIENNTKPKSVSDEIEKAEQRHLDNVERWYEAEQRLEQEEEFYNQDIYVDIEWMLQEQEALKAMTDEEYNQMVNEYEYL